MYNPDLPVFETKQNLNIKLAYGIEEVPKPFWKVIYFAFQITLVDFTPFIWAGMFVSLAGLDSGTVLPLMISACFFCMGFSTLIQTIIGNKLPIVQGPSASLTSAMGPVAATYGLAATWGAVLVGGVIEALLGATKVMSKLRKLLTPTVIGTVVTAVGFVAARLAIQWTFSVQQPKNLALALVAFILALILKFKGKGIISQGFILVTVLIVGIGGGSLLGIYDWGAVVKAPWFALPKLFPLAELQNGKLIEFVPAAIIGCFAGYIGSMFESVGDYAATCAACDETYKVKHIDKGIMAEGIGCAITSVFGGMPCTSYTQNIGIISATGVCSRKVTQAAAILFFLYALCPKMAYMLSCIPKSVIGAVFLITAATIMFSGIDTITSDKPTLKNRIIAGTTLAVSVMLPYHCASTFAAWAKGLPSFVNMVITSTVFLAVIVGIFTHILLNMVLKTKDD